MKKWMKVLALAMACMMIFSACQREVENDTPVNSTTENQQTEEKEEENKEEEPEADPKDEILAKAKEDSEVVLETLKGVIETYRSGTLPDYYEAYPDKLAYPELDSVDAMTMEKGDGDCDVNVFVKAGNQTLCVSLKYVEGSENPWMVVKTAFGGIKG